MEIPHGAGQFTFPRPGPSSPPATPGSSRSRNTSATSSTSVNPNRRNGFIHLGLSPPENIEPKGFGHQFSYTPPDRDRPSSDSDSDSDSSDSSDDVDGDDEEEADAISEVASHSDVPDRRPSVVRQIDEETDITVEEVSEDDIAYDDAEVVRPDQTEDAKTDDGSQAVTEATEEDILHALKNLKCGSQQEQEKAHEFEEAQQQKYRKKKKRWSMGGRKKRSHAQSIGSQSSDNADVEPLDDIHLPGSSTRRLRRRTQGPEDLERPNRSSLLLDSPPAELEELVLDVPLPLISDSDEDSSKDDGEEEDDDDDDEDIELLLPAWLMEVDSNPSRPSTSGSQPIAS